MTNPRGRLEAYRFERDGREVVLYAHDESAARAMLAAWAKRPSVAKGLTKPEPQTTVRPQKTNGRGDAPLEAPPGPTSRRQVPDAHSE